MMIHFSGLHIYCLLNAAVALSYLVCRMTLSVSFIKQKLLQAQQLWFARHSFLIIVLFFMSMPYLFTLFPVHSDFQLAPIVRQTADQFFLYQEHLNKITPLIKHSSGFTLPITQLVFLMYLLGLSIHLFKHVKNLIILRKQRQHAFCRHRINNVYILFSSKVTTPFCWSGLKKHFVMIPEIFLENRSALKIILRHELQHIRQHDTRWLHVFAILRLVCFWNPFVKLWINYLSELQEFSCDETIILQKRIPKESYAQCLIDATSQQLVPSYAIGMSNVTKSVLYRRVNMLFQYQQVKTKKLVLIFTYIFSLFIAVGSAYALNSSPSPMTLAQVSKLASQDKNDSMSIMVTPEMVAEINNIRGSEEARYFMRSSLERMKQYQNLIQTALHTQGMPNDLLVMPLVQSGYQPLDQSENPVEAAGIWQIIPSTAKHFGLVVSGDRDDRLDTELSTKAALTYLNQLHEQFHDWNLAIVAYEIGEKQTQALINQVGSRNIWDLARAPAAPKELKKYVAMISAAIFIMHNPGVLDQKV